MASTELVAFTEGRAVSAAQQIAQNEFHTLIPIFPGRPGAVMVEVLTSDGAIISHDKISKVTHLRGPLEYQVSVRRAGCDLDDGT